MSDQTPKVKLQTPWGKGYPPNELPRLTRGDVAAQICEYVGDEAIASFIGARTELHALYIRETEQTKRLGMILAAVLLALACILPIAAPSGRETLSYWISAGLFVFSAGAMGFTQISYARGRHTLRVSKDKSDA